MEVSPAIFRAYDIRGVVDEVLTPDVVREVGKAFGSECEAQGQKRVVVARDGRLSGPALSEALIDGLMSTGRQVIDIGMVPTPVLYYATYKLETGTGVMITGSHNPPNYNGLKMMMAGASLYGEAIQRLYQRIAGHEVCTGEGTLESVEILDEYIQRVVGDIQLARPMKIGVDCGNGVPGLIAADLLRKLGCEVVEMFSEVDGRFPNHHPDPSKVENLQDLIRAVDEHKLQLGLAFDGDGDRVGVIDNTGQIIWPDRQMILYSRDILSRHPGAKIIYDVKCSRHLGQAIQEAGGEPEMWKTGHSIVKARMRETGALLGGEMSGHIFFKERWYGFDDALYTAGRLLEILSKDNRLVCDIFAELPDSLNTPELNVSFEEGEHFKFMEQLVQQSQFPGAKVTTIDGIRVDFDDGWGLVRASNTTPSLVIRFEAENQQALERIQAQFRAAIWAVDSHLTLPF